MEFRDALKIMRAELGVTQSELAGALHISLVTVGRWERGKCLPNPSMIPLVVRFAGSRSASAVCINNLKSSSITSSKERMVQKNGNLYSVEHSSLEQLIDDASFPIYACDLQTDEIVYVNKKARAMIGDTADDATGKKCYECLMHRDTPCEFCHKDELLEDTFTGFEAFRPFDDNQYHIKGRILRWNGKKVQVRYLTEIGNTVNVSVQAEREKNYQDILHIWNESLTGCLASAHYNLSKNTVSDIRSDHSDLRQMLMGGNVNEVLTAIGQHTYDSAEQKKFDYINNSGALIQLFYNEKTHISIRHHLRGYKGLLESTFDLIQNPVTFDIEAIVVLRNITDNPLIDEIASAILCLDYETVVLMDAETGEAHRLANSHACNVIPSHTNGAGTYPREHCADTDVELIIRETNLETVKEQLKAQKKYAAVYSLRQDGKILYKRALYSYLDDTHATILCALQDVSETYREKAATQDGSVEPITDLTASWQKMLPVALSAMISTSEDITFIKDIAGRYIICSQSSLPALGIKNERDVIGKTDYDLFDKAIADSFTEDDRLVIATGKPSVKRDIKMAGPEGNHHIYTTTKYPLCDSSGKVIGLYAASRDVTKDRKTAFELSTLLHFIPSGVFKYSADDKEEFAYINRNFIESLGYTEEQFREKYHNCFREMIWHEDRDKAEQEIIIQEGNGEIGKFDYRIEAADGKLHWFHDEGVKVTDQDGKQWYYVTLVDITEQKETEANLHLAEEEYRIATRHSGHTIGRYDIAGQTLMITEDASVRLALPECISGVPYERVRLGKISGDTAAAYTTFYENIMRGKKEGTVTFKKLLSNGWRWIREQSTTIFDENGKPVSAIISYKDVTEQQEKETAYKKWQQALDEKPPETFTLFRYNVSKNTGLDSVDGTLLDFKLNDEEHMTFDERFRSFADQYVVKEDRSRYVSFVNADTMLANYYRGKRSAAIEFRGRLTNSEVHWLRLSVELVEYPNSTDIEAYMMFEDINESKLAELQTKEQAETDPLTGLLNRKTFAARLQDVIRNQLPGHCTALLLIDMDGFKQVNDNFGHSVGDQVLIDAANTMKSIVFGKDLVCRLGGDEYMVCLCDMPSRETIMKKAQQICTLTRRAFSFGIQLTASIGIAVCPNDGASFDELYCKADKALYHVKAGRKNSCAFYEEQLNALRDKTESTAKRNANGNGKILIVDDNAVSRIYLQSLFKDEYTVDTVDDGAKVLPYLRQHGHKVSIVLLDLMMPGMDGFAVLEKMRNDPLMKFIPVIVVSGVDDRETNLRAIRCGAFDFIPKPIDSELLHIRVNSAISRAENELQQVESRYQTLEQHMLHQYRSILKDDGTVLAEYDCSSGSFTYGSDMNRLIAGNYDSRTLFEIFIQDKVASGEDAAKLEAAFHTVLKDPTLESCLGTTVSLRIPDGSTAPFRVKMIRYSEGNQAEEKILLSLSDISMLMIR